MAVSLIQNALQVNFDSVLSFPDEDMVQMFKALESTGLRDFLGCPSVLYEDDLVVFFTDGFVRENAVISCVQGKFVEISEEQFAGVFGLPTEGLTSMDEVPKDLIYDAQCIFCVSRAGLVTKSSKQAKGFAAQICVLLKGATDLTLGEAKTFPPLKILTIKYVGTYVAKNKSITAEEVTDEPPVEKVVKMAAAKRRPAPAAEPVAKRKRTTVGRAAPTEKDLAIVPVVQDPEPISVVPTVSPTVLRRQAPTRKLILQESDDEQDEVVTEKTTDKEQIPEDMMLPSVTAEEPTKIKFGRGITFKEVNWYKASLPKINTADKGKEPLVEEIKGNPAKEMFTLICADIDFLVQIWEAVVEEISSFFYSFSLRSLSALQSVSDLAKKEERVLQWAETDSLQTAVQRRLYIIAKYREMLLRKFLEARHSNFESGTPTSTIDLQVLDLLSEAHSSSLIKLLEQLKQHGLEWAPKALGEVADLIDGPWTVAEGTDPWWRCGCRSTVHAISRKKQLPQRPFVDAFAPICIFIEPVQDLDSRKPFSRIVQRLWAENCVDIVQFSLFGHLQPVGTYNLCRDIVEAGPVVDIDAVPTGIFNAFQHRLEVEGFYDFFVQPVVQNISSSSSSESSVSIRSRAPDAIPSSSSSSASRMHFTEHIPQTSMPTDVVPSADYTESFAQLRASIDKIQFEQIQTRDDVDELKVALSSKIKGLEMRFAQVSSHQDMLLRAQIHDVRKEVQTQKAALSQDLDDFRKETMRKGEGMNLLFLFINFTTYIEYNKKSRESNFPN
ncbi:hypothetical protein F511_32210 [Dorcoceras hygrometricum]|uniref:Uncharacterized protein n=1 Tax=Dorcoceras hygrometricum TaxID=472368 RepID=A0A2Z7AGS5_9LAMI|nr:hypothetical protein F511_32210 [Dorcoceras hygrometricum]